MPKRNLPSYEVFVVSQPKEGSDRKPNWLPVGAMWPLRSGKGFHLVLADQLAVTGRLVILERNENQNRKREQPDPTEE